MDVEGLLNLEDYVPPQGEKQIAKKPPQYKMDPSFWQIPDKPPPPYESPPYEEEEQPALEAPPEEGDEEEDEANKLLDGLDLPNYDDVEKRLAQPEMNYERRQNYLKTVYKNAETRRQQEQQCKHQPLIDCREERSVKRKRKKSIKNLIDYKDQEENSKINETKDEII